MSRSTELRAVLDRGLSLFAELVEAEEAWQELSLELEAEGREYSYEEWHNSPEGIRLMLLAAARDKALADSVAWWDSVIELERLSR